MRQISKLFFTSFCILLLICSINQAQVKIKERVEIAPSQMSLQKNSDNVTTRTYTVRFELDWDKPNRNAALLVVFPSEYAQSTPWTNGSSLSLTVNDVEAPVNFMFQYRINLDWYEPSHVNYRIYVDDVLALSGSSGMVGQNGSIPYRNIYFNLEKDEYDMEIVEPEDFNTVTINTISEFPVTTVKARFLD